MSNNASRCSVFILSHRDLLVYAHIHRLLVSLPQAPSLVTTAISLSPRYLLQAVVILVGKCRGGLGNATGTLLDWARSSTARWRAAQTLVRLVAFRVGVPAAEMRRSRTSGTALSTPATRRKNDRDRLR